MKKIIIFALPIMMLLCSCESAGWQWGAAPDIITPGASAETKVRTWDENGKPHETGAERDPAFQ